MIAVPVYHLCVYNGIFYGSFGRNSYLGLALCCGGGVVADYAFMALSAYFLLDTQGKPVHKKFLSVLFEVAVIYVIKRITIESVFDYRPDNYMVHDFFLKGAWWFVYAYLAILLLYPLLNKWIYGLELPRLRLCCIVLGALLLLQGIFNKSNFGGDLTAFLCTYFYMGYLKRTDWRQMLFVKNKRSSQILFYLFMYAGLLVGTCILRTRGIMENESLVLSVIDRLLGKYCILQFFMGIDVFLLFKNIEMKYSKTVNRLARSTFTVFLLHESVLAVFWYFGKCRTELPYLDMGRFLLWTGIYVGCCFAVGIVIREIYERMCRPFFDRLAEKMTGKI